MKFAFESLEFENFLSFQVWSSDAGFMWASRLICWASYLSFNTLTFFLVLWYWPCVLIFTVKYSLSHLTKRNQFGHIDGVDPNVLFMLRKTTPAFIWANKEWQACLTSNFSGSQKSFSEMVSKKARMVYTTKTISGFARSGPPWSIIGLYLDNVGHDAPLWSQILPSPILFK